MNEFLKTMAQIDSATKYLQRGELNESGISCKNWELVHALLDLKYGDILDMGSSGSEILGNLVKLKFDGRKVGIDLAYTADSVSNGIELYKGDLMHTPFEDNSFDTIISLSTIEHEVDFGSFAKEVSRLLRKGGQLIVSFDYAPEKIDTSLTKLYSLSWNILSKKDVERLVIICAEHGLVISGEIDWTVQDMVINDQYCSPAKGVSYTFSILQFIKT